MATRDIKELLQIRQEQLSNFYHEPEHFYNVGED
jgi:hypothetical protein